MQVIWCDNKEAMIEKTYHDFHHFHNTVRFVLCVLQLIYCVWEVLFLNLCDQLSYSWVAFKYNFSERTMKAQIASTIFHKCQCRRREKVILSSLRSTLENRCHRYFKPCFVNIFPEIITGIKHYIFWSCLGPCLKTTINNMSRCFSFYVVSLWSAWLTAQSLVCVFQLIKAFPNDSGAHKQDRLIPYLPQGCIKCAKNNVLFKFYSI